MMNEQELQYMKSVLADYSAYGKCPTCGANGKSRERRMDGDTTCVNGHKHKSADFDKNK